MSTNEELEEKINELSQQFKDFKMFRQRRDTEIRTESKAYGAEILERVEGLQEQIDYRFDASNQRLDAMNALMESVSLGVDSLMGLIRRGMRDSQTPPESGYPEDNEQP